MILRLILFLFFVPFLAFGGEFEDLLDQFEHKATMLAADDLEINVVWSGNGIYQNGVKKRFEFGTIDYGDQLFGLDTWGPFYPGDQFLRGIAKFVGIHQGSWLPIEEKPSLGSHVIKNFPFYVEVDGQSRYLSASLRFMRKLSTPSGTNLMVKVVCDDDSNGCKNSVMEKTLQKNEVIGVLAFDKKTKVTFSDGGGNPGSGPKPSPPPSCVSIGYASTKYQCRQEANAAGFPFYWFDGGSSCYGCSSRP